LDLGLATIAYWDAISTFPLNARYTDTQSACDALSISSNCQ